jgi:hypothetical protein
MRANDDITDMANKLGRQGWEMSAAAGAGWGGGMASGVTMVWCFERPLGAAASAPVSAQ